jgi:hypothetical protein
MKKRKIFALAKNRTPYSPTVQPITLSLHSLRYTSLKLMHAKQKNTTTAYGRNCYRYKSGCVNYGFTDRGSTSRYGSDIRSLRRYYFVCCSDRFTGNHVSGTSMLQKLWRHSLSWALPTEIRNNGTWNAGTLEWVSNAAMSIRLTYQTGELQSSFMSFALREYEQSIGACIWIISKSIRDGVDDFNGKVVERFIHSFGT